MLPRADIDQNLLVAWYGKPVESKRSAVAYAELRGLEERRTKLLSEVGAVSEQMSVFKTKIREKTWLPSVCEAFVSGLNR